jgi:hypothetical protein
MAALIQILRTRWFSLALNTSLWLLLFLVIRGLGGKAPDFRTTDPAQLPTPIPVPVGKLDSLFSSAQLPRPGADSNAFNLFFTRFFVPPPAPAPPPAPTTKKIEVTYQGFYQSGEESKHAVIKIADAFVVAKVGTAVMSTNLFVSDATMQSLILTNLASETNVLPLNIKKEIEVPIK